MESKWFGFDSIIIPGIHPRCITSEQSRHKLLTIGHDILPLVTINIHPILLAGITPSKLFQPLSSSSFGDFLLLDASRFQPFLYFWAGNNFDDVQHLDEIILGTLCQLQLYLHGNVLILENTGMGAFIPVQGKFSVIDKPVYPLPNHSCMISAMSLRLRHNQ